MKVYVGQTRSRELVSELNGYGWGEMTQPKEVPPRRRPFTLDNYAYACFKQGKPWDEARFLASVAELERRKLTPDFVVAPDIVAGGWASLAVSLSWRERLQGFAPVYLAVQDGMTLDGVGPQLQAFDGCFVGGSKEWKMTAGYWWVKTAHAMGKPCHIGRISGREHVRLAKTWGADSFDSCVPLWSVENRRQVLKALVDPPVDFDPPSIEQFLTGWEAL